MFGKNPIRKPVAGTGDILEVQEIFLTFQGEGPYAGWPAVFIRLGGCNLACHFCDTEFDSFTAMTLPDILARTRALAATGLVVITGGEPFRQPIEKLCGSLVEAGYQVQIETNGTIYRPVDPAVSIVCSPKNTGNGYHPIRPDLLPRLTAFKFLISAEDTRYNHVPELGQGEAHTPVYVQPMDEYNPEKNARNREYMLQLAQQYGYRVSLQLHKVLGIA